MPAEQQGQVYKTGNGSACVGTTKTGQAASCGLLVAVEGEGVVP